ncbi:hypothetical protein FB567DRAFT_405 [Paraphoma chrysanthemicola]|uniref:G domain-containing protein n=1 Tax=Paraphoma chrysanthemicola TaxID=798071 RepID=A0A8K0RGV4_9PLEO|nr:hypothetical protein FB567DRAFT_405 [Paraphoma chrysanthemicola]
MSEDYRSAIGILVMGLTGAGKSTFISQLTRSSVDIGHSLESCTTSVDVFVYRRRHGQKVYLIDTPGFDDSHKDNIATLNEIAGYICTFYAAGNLRIAGVLYFQRISDVRMTGSSLKSLRILERLCGDECFPKVTVVTTFWSFLQGDQTVVGEERERNLKKEPSFFGTIINGGASMVRYSDSYDSACEIVEHTLDKRVSTPLRIQKEMVDKELSLAETDVGLYLEGDLLALREKYERVIAELSREYDEAIADSQDEDVATTISEERKTYEERIRQGVVAQKGLSVTYQDMIRKQQNLIAEDVHNEHASSARAIEEKSAREIELEEQLQRTEMDYIRQVNIARRDKEAKVVNAFQQGYEMSRKDVLEQLRRERTKREKFPQKQASRTLVDLLRVAVVDVVEFIQGAQRRSDSFPVESTRPKPRYAKTDPPTHWKRQKKPQQRSNTYSEHSRVLCQEATYQYYADEPQDDDTLGQQSDDDHMTVSYPEGTSVIGPSRSAHPPRQLRRAYDSHLAMQ